MCVSRIPIFKYKIKKGISIAIGGVIRVDRIQKPKSELPLNLNLARTYAAGIPINNPKKVVPRATIKLS